MKGLFICKLNLDLNVSFIYIELTLEQHVFELRGSTYKRIFSINTVNVFSLSYDYLNILISLTYFIVRIQYIIHIT